MLVYHVPLYASLPALDFNDIPVLSCGYLGVPVFFMLSIILLLRSLDKNPDLRYYFTRRIKRIWPMYFASILMVFLYYSHSLFWLGEQATFIAVFVNSGSIGYVFWSLQVEEVAYLFFPLIQRLSPYHKYLTGLALYAAGLGSFILLAFNQAMLPLLWWLPLSLGAYGMGILVYLRRVPKETLPLALLGLFYWDLTIFVAASVLVIPGFAYVVQEAERISVLQSRALVKVGELSYGLYLSHPLMLSVFGFPGALIALPFSWAFERLGNLNR